MAQAFLTPKRDHVKTQTTYFFFFIFSRATLNETFMAKYDGVLPRTPSVRPTSEIYTPRRDDEHPHPFHMRIPPRGGNQGNDSGLTLLVKKGDRSKIIVDRAVLPTNGFLGVYLQLLNSQLLLRRLYLHLEFDFRSSYHLHVSFLSPVRMNSTNWSAPNVWAS